MSDISIKVDSSKAINAVMKFARGIENRQRLLVEMGLAMLVSIRRTFREQASPEGPWPKLAASTIKSNPKIYNAGHKLLIRSSRLLNSITAATEGEDSVIIGTNLVYAAVHQFGSRDRGMGEGPQARIDGRDVSVGAYHNYRLNSVRRVGFTVVDEDGKKHRKTMKQIGPRNAKKVSARAHRRFQNIPARPYMVFRAEDPQRLQELALNYVARCRSEAGLEGA